MSKSKVSYAPDQVSDHWNTGMKGSVTKIQQGVDSVTESPMEAAASQQEKMKVKLIAAIDNGSWARGLRAVDLNSWKQRTKSKVASNLGTGVDNAMDKRRRFDSYLVNTLNGVLPSIKGMSDLTIDDSIARSAALQRYMHDHPYKAG